MKIKASTLLRTLNILTLVGMSVLAVLGLVFYFLPDYSTFVGTILLTTGLGIAALNVVAMLFFRAKSELETVRKVNTNNFENKLIELEQQKAGILTYDKNGRIIHITDWLISAGFKNIVGKTIDVFEVDYEVSRIHEIEKDNRTFKIIHDPKKQVIFVNEITEFAKFREILENKQHAVLILDIQYSDKLRFNYSEFAKVQANMTRIISNFAERVGATVSTVANSDELIISTDWGSLDTWFGTERSNFLKLFNKFGDKRRDIIISGGLASANLSIAELTKKARLGLRTASNKGGNLIYVDLPHEQKFIGKSTIGFTEKTSVELEFFRGVIDEKIKNARNIFITTHAYADADAVASVAGMHKYVRNLRKRADVIVETMDNTTKDILSKYELPNFKAAMIGENDVEKNINENSLLIVTDTADVNRIQLDKSVIKKFKTENIIIIDHHRISGEQLETSLDSIYLDTVASSASEIVTELLYFQTEGAEDAIPADTATLLYLGSYIDTNGWTKNTGSTTHDTASHLIKSGATYEGAADYIKLPKEIVSQLGLLYENTTFYKGEYAFGEIPKEIKLDDEVISIFANKLLELEGINASFVIGKNNSKKVKVSARSNENVNVQAIMEEIGGGGHFDMSAAVFASNRRIPAITKLIKTAITNTK